MKPLSGIRVIDFTTLLPGPMATLILSEAGAEVIKIERPGGEDIRRSPPFIDDKSVMFSMLNRGKRSIEIDIKEKKNLEKIIRLIRTADVVVDQFRPGVMERIGLNYEKLKKINKKIVHCSITGYGQTGPKKLVAAHDINYMADSGLLSLAKDSDGSPAMPSAQIADIAGGSYPAVINILLALRNAEKTGEGSYLDISMTDNLFPFMWMALGIAYDNKNFPLGGDLHLTGASPRYGIYKTLDSGYIALGALEEKFWQRFCEIIKLDKKLVDDAINTNTTKQEIIKIISSKTTSYWKKLLAKEINICCSVVNSVEEALKDPQIIDRELVSASINISGKNVKVMPTPLAPIWRPKSLIEDAPKLGEANSALLEKKNV